MVREAGLNSALLDIVKTLCKDEDVDVTKPTVRLRLMAVHRNTLEIKAIYMHSYITQAQILALVYKHIWAVFP